VPNIRRDQVSAGGVALGKRDVPGAGPGFDSVRVAALPVGVSPQGLRSCRQIKVSTCNIPSQRMVRPRCAEGLPRQRGASLRRGGERVFDQGTGLWAGTCSPMRRAAHDAPTRGIALPLMADSRCPIGRGNAFIKTKHRIAPVAACVRAHLRVRKTRSPALVADCLRGLRRSVWKMRLSPS